MKRRPLKTTARFVVHHRTARRILRGPALIWFLKPPRAFFNHREYTKLRSNRSRLNEPGVVTFRMSCRLTNDSFFSLLLFYWRQYRRSRIDLYEFSERLL